MMKVVGTPGSLWGVSPGMRGLLACAGLVLLVASCTGTPEHPPPPSPPTGIPTVEPATDYSSFRAALKSEAHTVRQSKAKVQPGFEAFAVPARTVYIDGIRIWAFEYPTPRAFERMRSSISPTADTVGPAIIDWTDPHIYGSGRLIVLYLGDRRPTIRTLHRVLGPQFAGW